MRGLINIPQIALCVLACGPMSHYGMPWYWQSFVLLAVSYGASFGDALRRDDERFTQ